MRPTYDIQKYTTQAVDLSKMAADLGVDAILTATFIHEEDNLRITGQLIDTKTRGTLWNGGFDTKYNKLLSVQDKVARQIVSGLELTLSPSEAARWKDMDAVDPLAYEYYLRGVDLYARNDFHLASKVLAKSLEVAPNYTPAWASLGRAYTAAASFQFGGNEMYQKAEAAFGRALALNPDVVDAKVFMANMFTDTGRVERAVPLLRDALRAKPDDAEAHWELGYAYRFAGMLRQSVAECEKARELDPTVKRNSSALNSYLYLGQYEHFLRSLPEGDENALMVFYRGLGKYYLGRKQAATEDFDRAFEVDRTLLHARVGKAVSFAIQHRRKEAESMLEALESQVTSGGRTYDPEAIYKVAQGYAVLGNRAGGMRMLKRSVEGGFFPYEYLTHDPLLNALRGEREFGALMSAARKRHQQFEERFS